MTVSTCDSIHVGAFLSQCVRVAVFVLDDKFMCRCPPVCKRAFLNESVDVLNQCDDVAGVASCQKVSVQ